jgi:hypothetical protein
MTQFAFLQTEFPEVFALAREGPAFMRAYR